MARLDDLGNQHRSDGPFTAEPESLHRSREKKLAEGVRKAAQERESRKPQYCQLQYPRPPVAIREHAGRPSADGRRDQCPARNVAGLRLRYAPHAEQGGNDETIDHEIKAIEPVARICRE